MSDNRDETATPPGAASSSPQPGADDPRRIDQQSSATRPDPRDDHAVRDEDVEENDAEEAETSDATLDAEALRRELERARRQAARYRRERNELRERVQALTTEDPVKIAEARAAAAERRANAYAALSRRNAPPAVYDAAAALLAAESESDIDAAAERLLQALRGTATLPRPAPSSAPETLEERLRDAQARGDIREALRLKAELAQRAASLRGSGGG